MMKGREVFKVWAPIGAKWTQWVRPVPFIVINDDIKIYDAYDFTNHGIKYLTKASSDTAIIVDLPGDDSIVEGIALAKMGFRPIPVYNGTNEQNGAIATVDNRVIELGLVLGALELQKINLSKEAPPVFLLDSNRMNRYKMDASVFDNSWDIYHQDIPSCEYFFENGINNIIIRGSVVNKDLNKILYKFQRKGMKILFTNGYDEPKEVKLKKPKEKDK